MHNAKAKSLLKTGLAALVCAAFMVFAVGCSTNAPVAPSNGDPTNLKALNAVLDAFGTDPFASIATADDLAKQVWYIYTVEEYADVRQDGGTIYLELNGVSSQLEVPKNAVCEEADSNCFVRIDVEAIYLWTFYGDIVFYDFGPDGLVFNEDCTLLLDSKLPEGTVLTLFWYNPDTRQWEVDQQGEADHKGVVEFEINHFSKYAIS